MSAAIIQLRDYEWRAPPARPRADGSAQILILPVIRVERLVAEIVATAGKRRSLLGEP